MTDPTNDLRAELEALLHSGAPNLHFEFLPGDLRRVIAALAATQQPAVVNQQMTTEQPSAGVEAADHVPVSPDEAAAIDAAVGLVTLPPIRVSTALAEAIREGAAATGLIVQAHVRDLLLYATTPEGKQ